MSLARRLTRGVVATLLIVTAFAASHQHRVFSTPPHATFSHAESVDLGTIRVSDCAVCQALQSTEPAVALVAERIVVCEEERGETRHERLLTLPRACRSSRAPPALQA